MILSRLLIVVAWAGIAVAGSLTVAAEKEIVFQDDFNRDDTDSLGNDWTARGKAVLRNKAALFQAEEEQFRPRIEHRFTPQKDGKLKVSFVMDWLRESEGTWSLHIQLGHSAELPRLLIYNKDLAKGIGVHLVWGGGEPVNFQAKGSFGYSKKEEFHPLFVMNDAADMKTVVEKPVVTIEIDVDASVYSVTFNGKTYADLPFENKVPIDCIRFIANGCSTPGFTKCSIDDIKITTGE